MRRKRHIKLPIPPGYEAAREPIVHPIIGYHLIVTLDEGQGARIAGAGPTRREVAVLLRMLADSMEENGIQNGDADPDETQTEAFHRLREHIGEDSEVHDRNVS